MRGFFILWSVCVMAVGLMHALAAHRAAPDTQERIAATLVRWGMPLEGMTVPADREEVRRRIDDLDSPIGEVRVKAADWLAAHGVRRSGADIAAAMADPETRRPCQLAKSLGALGDAQWTGQLVAATQQQTNTDLRVCATMALGDLQSPEAVEALIDAYREGGMGTTALNALSRIADPGTLPFFRKVAAEADREVERNIARTAIERIRVLQQSDPAAALMDRLDRQAGENQIEPWTLRRLSGLKDPRAVSALREAYRGTNRREHRIWLTASMLIHGQAGRTALAELAEPRHNTDAAGTQIARAGLDLAAVQPNHAQHAHALNR